MKHALCIRHAVTLHLIHPEDLSLEAMRQKVGTSLPLRDLANHTRLAGYLDRIGRRYRRAAGDAT